MPHSVIPGTVPNQMTGMAGGPYRMPPSYTQPNPVRSHNSSSFSLWGIKISSTQWTWMGMWGCQWIDPILTREMQIKLIDQWYLIKAWMGRFTLAWTTNNRGSPSFREASKGRCKCKILKVEIVFKWEKTWARWVIISSRVCTKAIPQCKAKWEGWCRECTEWGLQWTSTKPCRGWAESILRIKSENSHDMMVNNLIIHNY